MHVSFWRAGPVRPDAHRQALDTATNVLGISLTSRLGLIQVSGILTITHFQKIHFGAANDPS